MASFSNRGNTWSSAFHTKRLIEKTTRFFLTIVTTFLWSSDRQLLHAHLIVLRPFAIGTISFDLRWSRMGQQRALNGPSNQNLMSYWIKQPRSTELWGFLGEIPKTWCMHWVSKWEAPYLQNHECRVCSYCLKAPSRLRLDCNLQYWNQQLLILWYSLILIFQHNNDSQSASWISSSLYWASRWKQLRQHRSELRFLDPAIDASNQNIRSIYVVSETKFQALLFKTTDQLLRVLTFDMASQKVT
jgi:hypothetical protein